MYSAFRQVYSIKYTAINIIVFLIYYLVFITLIDLQEGPALILSIPQYAIYLLLLTASIALTLSIYSINNTRRNYAKVTASGVSVLTTFVGSLVEGCGCTAPLIFSIFSVFGATAEAVPIYAFFVNYSTQIFAAMVLMNVMVISYYLLRFSTKKCKLRTAPAKSRKAK